MEFLSIHFRFFSFFVCLAKTKANRMKLFASRLKNRFICRPEKSGGEAKNQQNGE